MNHNYNPSLGINSRGIRDPDSEISKSVRCEQVQLEPENESMLEIVYTEEDSEPLTMINQTQQSDLNNLVDTLNRQRSRGGSI